MVNNPRIAVIIDGNIYDRKGMVNAALMRIKYLKSATTFRVDCYSIMKYGGRISNALSHYKMTKGPESIMIDGLELKIIWVKFHIIDSFISRLGIGFSFTNFLCKKKYHSLFSGYQLISAHSSFAGEMARYIHIKFDIPYVVTWHGSDIHTSPYYNKFSFERTKNIIENAKFNFYVSKKLQEQSMVITSNQISKVLYNGVNPIFRKVGDSERTCLKRKYKVDGLKVIAFVGNIIPIKNVFSLVNIFEQIKDKCTEPLAFWIVGDGILKDGLYERLSSVKNLNIKMWGNQRVQDMPSIMNCIDVLILPSFNEGLPLVLAEAISCGANAVGSMVGGIPETIGADNTFELDDTFAKKISDRVVSLLANKINQPINPLMDWETTAKEESRIIDEILKK